MARDFWEDIGKIYDPFSFFDDDEDGHDRGEALEAADFEDAVAGRRGEVEEAAFMADEAFHNAVSAMCRNDLVDKINRVVRVLTYAVRRKTVSTMISTGRARRLLDVHWRIYELLKSKNTEGLEEFIHETYFLDVVKN